MQTFRTGEVPAKGWSTFRKTALTQAVRIEGPLRCEDGWLAVDARGYPYPIAADEFDLIYEAV